MTLTGLANSFLRISRGVTSYPRVCSSIMFSLPPNGAFHSSSCLATAVLSPPLDRVGRVLRAPQNAFGFHIASVRWVSKRERMMRLREERVNEAEKFSSSSRRLLRQNMELHQKKQKFSHFLVIDLEATCDHKSNPIFRPNEIIEFPVFKVNASSFEVESVFHTFVRPTVNPLLKPFCTQLTGIIQDDIKDAPTFPEVLRLFEVWMRDEGLISSVSMPDSGFARQSHPERRFVKHLKRREGESSTDLSLPPPPPPTYFYDFAFVSCGDSDLGKMLPSQCHDLGITTPDYFGSWIDLKICFSQSSGKWSRGLKHMMDEFGLPMHGRAHSGFDDCTNLVSLMKALAEQKQYVFSVTSTFEPKSSDTVGSKMKAFPT